MEWKSDNCRFHAASIDDYPHRKTIRTVKRPVLKTADAVNLWLTIAATRRLFIHTLREFIHQNAPNRS